MAEVREPQPVALVVGMLSAFPDAFEVAEERLAGQFGPVEARSEITEHTFTDYYRDTMGHPLRRRFLSFAERIDPSRLAAIKRATNQIESDLVRQGRWPVARPVNLDPGYVTPAKLVLASCKDYTHRVYLGDGVYGEPTLGYVRGRWKAYEWTYPDYRTEGYHCFFSTVRDALVSQRRKEGTG